MQELSLTSKLDLGLYIVCVVKSASKEIRVLIIYRSFFCVKVALYLYKDFSDLCTENLYLLEITT